MRKRENIDQKYLKIHSVLELEFFDYIGNMVNGKLDQHRVLKKGKDMDEFNQRHRDLWKEHEAELIANGLVED